MLGRGYDSGGEVWGKFDLLEEINMTTTLHVDRPPMKSVEFCTCICNFASMFMSLHLSLDFIVIHMCVHMCVNVKILFYLNFQSYNSFSLCMFVSDAI